jgi:hypothetical protein
VLLDGPVPRRKYKLRTARTTTLDPYKSTIQSGPPEEPVVRFETLGREEDTGRFRALPPAVGLP